MEFNHKSVLLTECIKGLNIKPDGIYVDGTMGGAGHSKKIVEQLNEELNQLGYLTFSGRINANYFYKKVCYTEQ